MLRYLIAIIAGGLMPLAFSPFGFYPVAIFSLAVLFYLCLGTSSAKSFKIGLLYGLGYFTIGISWLQISIHQFGLPVLAFSISMTILFILLIALFPAFTTYFTERFFNHSYKQKLLIIYPAFWVIFEWIRSWLFTGFPWLTVGYSQIDSPLLGIGSVTGIYGISFFVAMTAGALVLLVKKRQSVIILFLAVVIPVWTGSYFLKNTEWTKAVGEEIKVAIVQGNIAQEIKWLPQQKQITLDLYNKLSEPFWDESDLIIWPETALPAFMHDIPDFMNSLGDRAKKSSTDIMLGLPTLDPTTGRYYNSMVSLGDETHIYHKQHLVPFGEYLPLKKWIDPILKFLQIPMSNFSKGESKKNLIETTKYSIGISVCYEDVFGEEVITGLPEADFLINVSNDAWFGDSLAPHQHLEMARMRAFETGRYLIRSTNTGISAIINQKGQVTNLAPQFEQTTLLANILAYEGLTPYARTGNMPIIIFCFLLLALSAIRERGET
ncbi:MAG: apolipoprotein N-acyltransferase [Gammaproteobacteria bacterium]